MTDELGEYLANLRCHVCDAHADHRQAGRDVCSKHIDPNVRTFCSND